jgi:hypothetical protein
MKIPVRTKGGIYFEKDTIEKWITTCGSICPITGDPLKLDDLILDQVMSNNIRKYNVDKALGRDVSGGSGSGIHKNNESEQKESTQKKPEQQVAGTYESKTNGVDVVGGGFANDDDLYVF